MADVIGFPQMSDLANNGGVTLGQMAQQAKSTAAPTYGEQVETTMNLANMMDQRRQAVAAKGLLGQQAAYDQQGGLTPTAHAALAAINPTMAESMANAEAQRQYRIALGQGSENRAQAMINAAQARQEVADTGKAQAEYKQNHQQQLDDNSTSANLINNATPETIGPMLDTYSQMHHGMFHTPGDIEQWNTALGRKPMLDTNGQPTGQYEQSPVDPQKLSALKQGVVAQANSFQTNKLDELKQAGIDTKDFQVRTINYNAEKEKEWMDRQNVALKTQEEKDKIAISQARERRMMAQLGGKMNDYEKQLSEAVKTELGGRGTIGIATKKVDAAIDTRAALDRYFDPQTGMYNVPSTGSAELATSLSNLLSVTGGGQGGSEAQRKDLQQATLKGDVNKILTYFSGVPQNATTQAALKIVANQIDAIGLQSEQNRNGYFSNFSKKFTALGVDPNKAKIIATAAGNSYADYLKNEYEKLGLPLDDRTLSGIYQNQQGATPGSPAKKKPAGTAAGATVDPNDPLGLFR
jgi:hypothetical protein